MRAAMAKQKALWDFSSATEQDKNGAANNQLLSRTQNNKL